MKLTFDTLIDQIFDENQLLYAVLSSPKNNTISNKITLRPIKIQNAIHYQASEFREEQAFHQNYDAATCKEKLKTNLNSSYKQALFCCKVADYHVLWSKKGKETILKKPPSHQEGEQLHNVKKHYILEEGNPIPFLVALGVMTPTGRILPKKSDKFKQLNRFLEMIRDLLPHLDQTRKLNIIDFGCGKAYLTFALYHYLKYIENYDVEIEGLDLKKEVIQECKELAARLRYKGLRFSIGDITNHQPSTKPDLVIALHACNTATDAAIEQAITWGTEVILAVPCCQHELFTQIKNIPLNPLLKHGILKERFAALATDAARAQLLEIVGYQTDVVEFIDLEHTPKNLMIRAIKRKNKLDPEKPLQDYLEFKQMLKISPSLERILKKA